MGIGAYIKRGIRYIIKGQPQINITTEIVQKTPNEIFKNKNILITGGSDGLGFYIAKKCVEEGAKVLIVGRKEEKLKSAIEKLGERASYMQFDVQKVEEMKPFIDEAYKKLGTIDCLVNNAGISLHEKEMKKVEIEGFDSQFNTNLRGSYFLAQAYLKKLEEEKQESGNIIFISSERGAQCDDIPYGLTKVAINSLTEGLSRRYYKSGVRVNAVAPGITASNMTKINKDENLYCEYNASERFFVPEEVAEVVAFLISDVSKCISGEVIYCDAGNHLNPWFA